MTRRVLTIRWTFYALATLLILFLQSQILGRISVWSVCPVVLPCLAAVAATREPLPYAVIYAIILGAVSDTLFVAALPCFYVLLCVASAILSSLVARHGVMPGLPCSLLCCVMALLLSGLLSAVTMAHGGASFGVVLGLVLRETVISLPFALVLTHPMFSRIHRVTTP